MLAYRVTASYGQPTGARRSVVRPPQLRDWIRRAWRNHTTRRYLGEMDDRSLSDLGISRAQAQFEASRWMWD